jgi:hypothetical protein
MRRPSRISTLLHEVRSAYADDGLRTLLVRAARFVPNKLVTGAVSRRSVSRSELQNLPREWSTVWHLDEEDPIRISPGEEEASRLFEPYPKEYSPDRPFVCQVDDCHLVGPTALAFTRRDRLITESLRSTSFDLDTLKRTNESYVRPAAASAFLRRLLDLRPGTATYYEFDYVFPLICPDSSYYHWFVEYLPKLRYLEHYERETGRTPTILVESDPRDFVVESLRLAGYGPDRYEEWEAVERRVRHLVVSLHRLQMFNSYSPRRSEYNPSRADLSWLRNRMRSGVDGGDTADAPDRIYVSRQGVSSGRGRKVANYDELAPLLDDRGFTPYALEDLSFEEQVALFAEAEVVMGPHGAGLVNVVFGDELLLVELFPEHKTDPYFYYIAQMFGFDYEPVTTAVDDGNLVVDVRHVEARLNELDL